jgi:cell division protein ZipA
MDGLRWLLLLFGLLVIAGVYLYSRRDRSAPETEPVPDRREPTLGGEPDDASEKPVPDEPVPDERIAADDAIVESLQKIVTLRLVAKDGGAFAGDELILGMRGIGLRHGKFGIFHRYEGSDEDNTIFSAASLVEPGSFDLSNIKEQQLPGISLFLILPGPIDGAEAFDLMMSAARALAQALDGELLDESGSTLSIQRERYLREEIIQFEHSIKVA